MSSSSSSSAAIVHPHRRRASHTPRHSTAFMCNGIADGCSGCSICFHHNDHHPAHRTTPENVAQLLLQVTTLPGIRCPICNTNICYNIRFDRDRMTCGLCNQVLSKVMIETAIALAQAGSVPPSTVAVPVPLEKTLPPPKPNGMRDERRPDETFATTWKSNHKLSTVSNNQHHRFSTTALSGSTTNVSNAKLTDVDDKQQIAIRKIPGKISGRPAKPLKPIETSAQTIVAHQQGDDAAAAESVADEKKKRKRAADASAPKRKRASKKVPVPDIADDSVAEPEVVLDPQQPQTTTTTTTVTVTVRPQPAAKAAASAAAPKSRKRKEQEPTTTADPETSPPPRKPKRQPKVISEEAKTLRKAVQEQKKQQENKIDYERRLKQGRKSFEDQVRVFVNMQLVTPPQRQKLMARFDQIWKVFVRRQAGAKARDPLLHIPSILYLLLLDTNVCALSCKDYLRVINSEIISVENPILDKQYRQVLTTLRKNNIIVDLPLADLAMRYIPSVVKAMIEVSEQAQEARRREQEQEALKKPPPLKASQVPVRTAEEHAECIAELKTMLETEARKHLVQFCHPDYHYFLAKRMAKRSEAAAAAAAANSQQESSDAQMESRLNAELDDLAATVAVGDLNEPASSTDSTAATAKGKGKTGVKAFQKASLANAHWVLPALVATCEALKNIDSNNVLMSCFRTTAKEGKEFMELMEVKGKRFQDEKNAMNKFLKSVPEEKLDELELLITGKEVVIGVRRRAAATEEEEEGKDVADAGVPIEDDGVESNPPVLEHDGLDLSGLAADLESL